MPGPVWSEGTAAGPSWRGHATFLGFSFVGMLGSTLTFVGLTFAYHTFSHMAQRPKQPYMLFLGLRLLGGFVYEIVLLGIAVTLC